MSHLHINEGEVVEWNWLFFIFFLIGKDEKHTNKVLSYIPSQHRGGNKAANIHNEVIFFYFFWFKIFSKLKSDVIKVGI